jgi:large subunit ribosomal protein L24
MYLRRNDQVEVISGAQRGQRGRVLKVLDETNQVIVQGINLRYKHIRRSQKNPQGGRIQKEAPVAASNVLLVDPRTDSPTRVGFRIESDGRKVRFAKKSGELV